MDAKNKLTGLIEEAAAVAAQKFGLKVWGIELAGGTGRPVARIYIDAPWEGLEDGALTEDAAEAFPDFEDAAEAEDSAGAGVTVDECAEISRMIGLALDVEDIFTTAWVLEVSSPGLERAFFRADQLPPYIGSRIDVTLLDMHPDFPSRRRFTGKLGAVSGGSFTLLLDDPAGTECRLEWDQVRKAHLIHIFPDTTLPKARSRS